MKRMISIFIIAVILISTGGCGSNGDNQKEKEGELDYNDFMVFKNPFALTPSGQYINVYDYIYYMTDGSPCSILCSKAECGHNDQECDAYFEGSGLTYSNERLYYVGDDQEGEFGLYQMSLTGRERKLVKKLDILTENIGKTYNLSGCGDHIFLSLEGKIYLIDLDKKNEPELIVQPDEKYSSYGTYKVTNQWLVMSACFAKGEYDLLLYNIKTKEKQVLYEKFVPELYDFYFSDKNEVYYFIGKDGFYKKNLDTGEVVKFRDAKGEIEDGCASYDDKYVYISTVPQLTGKEKGVRIYDREGKLIEFLSTEEIKGNIIYGFSTKERVYFINSSSADLMIPAYSIQKDTIGSGKVKFEKVKKN
ncbi:MAG: hypothetical protein RR364_07125 [Lachnospiraceae bacterium]